MAKLKPKTKVQKDKATSARLLKTYGISLDEYNALLASQGFVCKICQKPPANRRLHTDHCHNFVRQKITTHKTTSGKTIHWTAWVEGTSIKCTDSTKPKAVAKVRHDLKRRSVRGLLCAWCNRGLRFYHDDPDILQSASQYIKNFHTLCGA